MFRRPINSTSPAHVVHDNSTSDEPIYPFSSSLGASFHPRHQSLSLAPKSSNNVYDQNDEDDDNVSVEATSGVRHYKPPSDYKDRLHAARAYKADIQAKAAMLTANFVREQQHLKATTGRRASYFAGLSVPLSRYEDNLLDAAAYESVDTSSSPLDPALSPRRQSLSLADNQDDGDLDLEDAAGHPASCYGAVFDSISYGDKLYDAATYEADIAEEPVKLNADLPHKPQHAEAISGRPVSYFAGLDDSSSNYEGKPIYATSYQADITGEPPFTGEATVDIVSIRGLNGLTYRTWTPENIMRKQQKAIGSSRENPYASTLNTKPRENRRKVLRIQINNEDHFACPDSGSEKNIISKASAIEHGFRIRRRAKDKKRFEVGNGDAVWSIGRVSETVGLPGSPLWQKKRQFYVLENCPVPLVMGMEFLREAEILTKYRHLLEKCPAEMCNISSLLWIGSPRNRLRCTLDGRQLEAVADTGSDLNLMSLACAEREGFRIDRRMEARTQIVVGSGKVIETLGQVYVSNLTLDWREPEAEPPEQSPRRPALDVPLEPDPHGSAYRPQGEGDDEFYIPFHVVENLPCDIIFGHKFLDDTDAFNKCPELLDIHPRKRNRHFGKHKQQFEFMIFRSKILPHISLLKKPKLAVDVGERHESDWHAERHRRSKNTEEKIALLPPGDREAARRSEAKKVRDWNTAHANCRSCSTGSTT